MHQSVGILGPFQADQGDSDVAQIWLSESQLWLSLSIRIHSCVLIFKDCDVL